MQVGHIPVCDILHFLISPDRPILTLDEVATLSILVVIGCQEAVGNG